MSAEQWLDIPGYEGLYEVSDLGRVRSTPRPRCKGGVLRLSPRGTSPYLRVSLCRPVNDIKVHSVHRLVAAAFLGPCPPGLQVRHLDGDPLNNQAGNLQYGTAKENAEDRRRHGNHRNGRKTHCIRGHDFADPAVVYVYQGRRQCRVCTQERRARVA